MELKCKRNYDDLHEVDRMDMKVDEILALYLYRLSNRVNQDYYKNSALPFVILFRECLNEYGWGKKLGADEDEISDELLNSELDKNPNLRNEI